MDKITIKSTCPRILCKIGNIFKTQALETISCDNSIAVLYRITSLYVRGVYGTDTHITTDLNIKKVFLILSKAYSLDCGLWIKQI